MHVQGYIEGRVVARVDVPPLRKNAAVSGDKKSVSKKQALLRRQRAIVKPFNYHNWYSTRF